MHPSRFTQLAIAALLLAAGGFATMGLSRVLVGADVARVLGAPLLFAGFLLAAATFVLAVLARAGAIEFGEEA